METNKTSVGLDYSFGPVLEGVLLYHVCVLILIEGFLLVGNVINLVTLSRYRELQSNKNMLIASLSVSDLIVGACSLTGGIIDMAEKRSGVRLSWHRTYATSIGVHVSFFHVICIALDRFIAVVRPLNYDTLVTRRTVCVMLMASWMIPIVSLIPLYEYTVARGGQNDMDALQAKVTVIFCVIVICVICPLYGKVLAESRSQVRKIRAVAEGFNNRTREINKGTHKITHRGTRMILVLILTACSLNAPYVAAQCIAWIGYAKGPAFIILMLIAKECALANSAVNIVIYAVFSREFRNAYRDMLCRCIKRKKDTEC